MRKRCGDRRGFTLVEVLCAFLMLSLSAALLLTGIGAAGSINRQARVSQQAFYSELSWAESQTATQTAPPTEGEAKFYAVDDTGAVASEKYGARDVDIYTMGPGALGSYHLK